MSAVFLVLGIRSISFSTFHPQSEASFDTHDTRDAYAEFEVPFSLEGGARKRDPVRSWLQQGIIIKGH